MTKHSPGPWSRRDTSGGIPGSKEWSIVDANGETVADGTCECGLVGGGIDVPNEADAALMIAAPTMRALLERALPVVEDSVRVELHHTGGYGRARNQALLDDIRALLARIDGAGAAEPEIRPAALTATVTAQISMHALGPYDPRQIGESVPARLVTHDGITFTLDERVEIEIPKADNLRTITHVRAALPDGRVFTTKLASSVTAMGSVGSTVVFQSPAIVFDGAGGGT